MFLRRRKAFQICIEDESIYFFRKMDKIENKTSKEFCIGVINCALGDSFDFFIKMNSRNNLFYIKAKQLDRKFGRKLFKLVAIYNYVCSENIQYNLFDIQELEINIYSVFDFNSEDKEILRDFISVNRKSFSEFSLSFSQFAAKELFNISELSSISQPFIINYFFNMHQEFINPYFYQASSVSRG